MGKKISPEEIEKILIINLGGIGDFLLSLPALKVLRNFYQKSHIVLLTLSRTLPLAEDSSYLNEVLILDFRLCQMLRLLIRLRRKRFALALNMRAIVSRWSAIKMWLVFYIIRARHKAGRNTEGRGFFFDIKVPECEREALPEYEYNLNIIRALGIEVQYSLPEIKIHEEDASYLKKFLAENNIRDTDIVIGINPGAPWPAKRWPAENFAAVINMLGEKIRVRIVITGSRDESGLAEEIERLSRFEVVKACGKTSLRQLAALIKRCNLYITNDTGPMHIAAILKTPLIAIFGPGSLTRFDPRNIFNRAIVLYKKAECAPCEKFRCRDLKCLKEISPEEVVEAALKLLGP